MGRRKKLISAAILIFFVVVGASTFPIYNLVKAFNQTLTIMMVIVTIVLYYYLGSFEKSLFGKAMIQHIVLLNVCMIALSLGCRYLLEFGEVSNAYNFTIPNVCLHTVSTLIISVIAWGISKRNPWLIDK